MGSAEKLLCGASLAHPSWATTQRHPAKEFFSYNWTINRLLEGRMFDKQQYIESGIYQGDEYLIQPTTAVKKCRCCHELKYSGEYPDWPEYPDGKLSVCRKCARIDEGREIVNQAGFTQVCRTCKVKKPLGAFNPFGSGLDYRTNEKVRVGKAKVWGYNPFGIQKRCTKCSRKKIGRIGARCKSKKR